MVKLIVDSGSTKTDWCFAMPSGALVSVKTGGINPAVQDAAIIEATIKNHLLPSLPAQDIDPNEVGEIYYYGAGCTPDRLPVMRKLLTEAFGCAQTVEVCSDLLAAARALCLRKKGIACILGTGANSCLYDGEGIVAQTPALGYILGDEGSGAVLGRNFINGILKGWLPEELRNLFMAEWQLDVAEIINKVYREQYPNRFLASISTFIASNMERYPQLADMVVQNFEKFIDVNIQPYLKLETEAEKNGEKAQSAREINAVGSIAYYFRNQLERAANNRSLSVGRIIKSPMQGLVEYHLGE